MEANFNEGALIQSLASALLFFYPLLKALGPPYDWVDIIQSASSLLPEEPVCKFIFLITPSAGEVMEFSIFIASRTITTSPDLILSPSLPCSL